MNRHQFVRIPCKRIGSKSRCVVRPSSFCAPPTSQCHVKDVSKRVKATLIHPTHPEETMRTDEKKRRHSRRRAARFDVSCRSLLPLRSDRTRPKRSFQQWSHEEDRDAGSLALTDLLFDFSHQNSTLKNDKSESLSFLQSITRYPDRFQKHNRFQYLRWRLHVWSNSDTKKATDTRRSFAAKFILTCFDMTIANFVSDGKPHCFTSGKARCRAAKTA